MNKNKLFFDFSNYTFIDKLIAEDEYCQDIFIYQYSNLEPINIFNDFIHLYFFDKYDIDDYKEAYIIMFLGDNGAGKTTAINALFNIIKGITIEDYYRFVLIKEEENNRNYRVYSTKGINLYYIKDYYNKPIIIIDTQGYGDTRGIRYDETIYKCLNFVFSNFLNHINLICYCQKAYTYTIGFFF